ncbi:MAG TPA: pyruvate kinase [Panacibacter sp.]|nr:pyruvate kinase [Panacibacter sp.]HNP45098.1 pyruvate kinase [Panacibacter sp.]
MNTSGQQQGDLNAAKIQLLYLLQKMDDALIKSSGVFKHLHPSQLSSAYNLVQYLALRSEDVRNLQDQLHMHGLSSLASSESHIRYQLQSILTWLGETFTSVHQHLDYYTGRQLIEERAIGLFGKSHVESIPSIMVTFDREFAGNVILIKKLLETGMNVARINTAHDDAGIWSAMITTLKQASQSTGIECKIFMDLAGPKLRSSVVGKGHSSGKVAVFEGQQIYLTGPGAGYDPLKVVISCDEPGVVTQLKNGDRVLFDDGMIESVVEDNDAGMALLRVNRVSSKKQQLKEGKGINFPDSALQLASLSAYDIKTLPFICENADLIGYSFVRDAGDVKLLQDKLSAFKKRPAITLKIETPDAVKNLPSLLLQGMQESVFAVMIARGDLAVEIGFERMSEIQEEILWISEAAHVPVIWATQVLETLNKSGIATRSEVTDAAYAGRSECVMINKGDYIINVIRSLVDILQRSGMHHAKKRYTFRPMNIASNFFDSL